MRLLLISAFSAISFVVTGCDRAVTEKEQVGAQSQGSVKSEESPIIGEPNGAAQGAQSAEIDIGPYARLTREFEGQPVPDVQFTGADGRKLNLSDFSGRPLLVNVWATWCAPCRKEMPALDNLAQIEAGQISIIAISQDLEGRKPVRKFFDSTKIVNLEPYIDPPNRISKALGTPILPLPATIMYNSAGQEVWRVLGAAEWDTEEIAAFLDEAL